MQHNPIPEPQDFPKSESRCHFKYSRQNLPYHHHSELNVHQHYTKHHPTTSPKGVWLFFHKTLALRTNVSIVTGHIYFFILLMKKLLPLALMGVVAFVATACGMKETSFENAYQTFVADHKVDLNQDLLLQTMTGTRAVDSSFALHDKESKLLSLKLDSKLFNQQLKAISGTMDIALMLDMTEQKIKANLALDIFQNIEGVAPTQFFKIKSLTFDGKQPAQIEQVKAVINTLQGKWLKVSAQEQSAIVGSNTMTESKKIMSNTIKVLENL